MDNEDLEHESVQVDAGIVYVLINPAMPGYVKIGKTTNLIQRIAKFNSDAVPEPFVCVYAAKVSNRHKVEQLLHAVFSDRRATRDREFFKIDPDDARQILLLMTHEDVTISDAPNGVAVDHPQSPYSRVFSAAHMSPLRVLSDEERIIQALTDNGGSFRSQKELCKAMKLSPGEISRMLRNCSQYRVERVWSPQGRTNVIRLRA